MYLWLKSHFAEFPFDIAFQAQALRLRSNKVFSHFIRNYGLFVMQQLVGHGAQVGILVKRDGVGTSIIHSEDSSPGCIHRRFVAPNNFTRDGLVVVKLFLQVQDLFQCRQALGTGR